MKSKKHGGNTSKVEVLNISKAGLWIYVKDREYFLSYKDFPWFKGGTVSEICNAELLHGDHLRWEDLDIDLQLDSLDKPDKYPLKYKGPVDRKDSKKKLAA